MAGDDEVKFRLDLDAKEALEKALHFKDTLHGLGEIESIAALAGKFAQVGIAVGVVGTAVFAIKSGIDAIFEGEALRAIDAQFEMLARNAGIASEALKQGLKDSSKGLIDESELLKIANEGMLRLGQSAERLPEILELSRKTALIMGRDTTEVFSGMNAAIATGNTRALRSYGIYLDQRKVMKDYAESIGHTAGELSQFGKQQAILEALLAQGNKAFEGQSGHLKENTKLWTQIKVTIKDVGDTLALAFEKIAGPTLKTYFQGIKAMADDLKRYIEDKFGEGAAKETAHIDRLREQIQQLKGDLIDLDQKQLKGGEWFPSLTEGRIEEKTRQLKVLQDELDKTTKKATESQSEAGPVRAPGSTEGKESAIDQREAARHRVEMKAKEIEENQKLAKLQSEQTDTIDAANASLDRQKQLLTESYNVKIAQLRLDEQFSPEQKNRLEVTMEQQKVLELKHLEDTRRHHQEQSMARGLANAKSVNSQMAASAQLAALKSSTAWKKSGGIGGAAMKAFQGSLVKGFQAAGREGANVAEELKNAFFHMLGDIATQQGEFMILDSFKSFPAINAPELAAGTALVALGGFLGGQGSGTGGAPGGGGGDMVAKAHEATKMDEASASQFDGTAKKKSVNLIIQGHVFETEKTQRWLVDQVRAASDATDFRVQTSTGSGL